MESESSTNSSPFSSSSGLSQEHTSNPRHVELYTTLEQLDDTEQNIFAQLLSGNYNQTYKEVFQNYTDIKNEKARGIYHICYYLKEYSSFTEDEAMSFINKLKNERKEKYPNDPLQKGYLKVIKTSKIPIKYTFLDELFGYPVNRKRSNKSLKAKGRQTPGIRANDTRSDRDDLSTVSGESLSSINSNRSIYYRESLSNIKKRKIRKPIIVTDLGYDPEEVAKLHESKRIEKEDSSPEEGNSSPDQGDLSPESQGSYPSQSSISSYKAQKREPILSSSIYNYIPAKSSHIVSIYDMDINLIIEQATLSNVSEETMKNLLQQKIDTQQTMQSISSSRGGYYKTRKRNRKKRKNKSKKYYKKK